MSLYKNLVSEDLKDLWISTGFILYTLVISELLRFFARWIYKSNESLSKKLICEFLVTGELCSCCFELCILAENYGIKVYATYLFLLTIWWSIRWGDATACPYTHIEDLMQGQSKFTHVILIIIIQVLGGWAIYPFYVKKFWKMKMESIHASRILANQCSADLTVPVLHGAVIEGMSTCMCQLTGRVMSKLKPKYGIPITSLIGTLLVVAAFDMSGGYFNPVLATSLQYNCGNITKYDHFKVYWGGAIAGSVLSVLIWHSSALSRQLLGQTNKLE